MSLGPLHTNVSTLGPISSPTPKGQRAVDMSPVEGKRWVVIFGAGASRAGDQSLPLDRDFLELQVKEVEGRPFLHKALEILYGAHWKYESLENAWSEIDNNYNNPKVTLNTSDVRWIFDHLEQLADKEESPSVKYYRWYQESHHRFSPARYLFIFAGWELRNLVTRRFNNLKTDCRIHKHLYSKLSNKRSQSHC